MCITTDNRQEATSCPPAIRAELDGDGVGAGEGTGEGGAEVGAATGAVITIVIITITGGTATWAAVALGGGSIIDLHPVHARRTNNVNIQTVEGEGDWLSIA